jgi:hypothetical protein
MYLRARGALAQLGAGPLWALALGLLAVVARFPSLAAALNENKLPFRQTQTAYTAVLFHREGIHLLEPQLPVLGPPYVVPIEFPLYQAGAALGMDVGIPEVLALRLTTLATFFLSGLLIWLVLQRLAGVVAATAGMVLFLWTPLAMPQSRTPSIEYAALAGSIAWFLFAMTWIERPNRTRWAVATLAGTVGLLVKVTTGFVWALPILVYAIGRRDSLRSSRARIALLGLLVVPVVATGLWTLHADQLKAESPLTAFLTSSALAEWNFGTIAQRLDPTNWARMLDKILREFGGPIPLAIGLAGTIVAIRRLGIMLGLALVGLVVGPVLVFFNLHVVHDYYQIAISPGVAILQGIAVGALAAQLRWRTTRMVVAAAIVGLVTVGLAWYPGYWDYMYRDTGDPDRAQAQSRELARASQPTDGALVLGRDWSSVVLFMASRKGLAVPGWLEESGSTDLIDPRDYQVASLTRPANDAIELLRPWALVGVVGSQTYRLASDPGGLAGARIFATDTGTLSVPDDAVVVHDGPLVIPCDQRVHQIPMGGAGTWLELAPAPRTARLYIVNGFGPLPARPLIVVSGRYSAAGMGGTAACAGTSQVVILRILNAAVPPT